ncbi:c6 zinc finger domain containing protein [Grosmannia clavigera kw1407]|uniref:C6 zinc finger domain containing protein n=1 Tax=Grosmannia clavigera (strain kw1407 / UAMH 11150) TaxID=655863 RepID=F0XS91_GROCL|nr:c6 zinc finger domain containing protein [Grosmannia clavigera kw1407]EFW99612.1 c6 zinc finger domain containing protein [Grosmannia clavigera kw1407]
MNTLQTDGMIGVHAGEAVTSVPILDNTMPVLCDPGAVPLSSDASLERPNYDETEPLPKKSPSETSAMTANSQALPLAPFSTVSTACLGCRGKHLKCDGRVPCSRCQLADIDCVYIASRRGYKGPRKPNKRLRSSSSSPPPPSVVQSSVTVTPDSCPMLLGAPRAVVSTVAPLPGSMAVPMTVPMTVPTTSYALPRVVSDHAMTTFGSMPPGYTTASTLAGPGMAMVASTPAPLGTAPAAMSHMNLYRNPFSNGLDGANYDVGGNMALSFAAPPVRSLDDRCFDAFYHFFFGGHPFVLPKGMMMTVVRENTSNMAHLIAAMRYIGSLYIDAGPARARFFDEAIRLAYLSTCPQDGFLVQTLLMLIVGLDGNCEQERARQLLADCERIAVDIKLNHRSFASTNGRGNPVLEESWRRTWWDLFVVDGMVAGVHRMTNFNLFDIPTDVALPCEEEQYLSGNIPTPAYIEDFDDQIFTGEDREFSSFAYRIAAGRILGRFMRCSPIHYAHDENLEKIQSLLSNWRMHLPASKRDNLTKTCQLDEMMFQAHFMTHACSIMLHQPHSQLDSSPTRSVTSCAPHSHVPSGDAFNTHTKHTITAACEISKMVTQAVPLLSHTHFFTCVITLSSIVHLSKWALYFIQDEEDLRQQIRLNIGALSKLSEVWRAANTAGGQVKGVAQEIYRAKKAQQINPAFWVGFTQEEMISSINADESIMSEFDNMLPVATQ